MNRGESVFTSLFYLSGIIAAQYVRFYPVTYSGHISMRVEVYGEDFTPTKSPSSPPSISPTLQPTNPTSQPTVSFTTDPTTIPTDIPTYRPTNQPSKDPTKYPTKNPSQSPSGSPSAPPTNPAPTRSPSKAPTDNPSSQPSNNPSNNPSESPSKIPTAIPLADGKTMQPTMTPSNSPTIPIPTTSINPLCADCDDITITQSIDAPVIDNSVTSKDGAADTNPSSMEGDNNTIIILIIVSVIGVLFIFIGSLLMYIYTKKKIINKKTNAKATMTTMHVGNNERIHDGNKVKIEDPIIGLIDLKRDQIDGNMSPTPIGGYGEKEDEPKLFINNGNSEGHINITRKDSSSSDDSLPEIAGKTSPGNIDYKSYEDDMNIEQNDDIKSNLDDNDNRQSVAWHVQDTNMEKDNNKIIDNKDRISVVGQIRDTQRSDHYSVNEQKKEVVTTSTPNISLPAVRTKRQWM